MRILLQGMRPHAFGTSQPVPESAARLRGQPRPASFPAWNRNWYRGIWYRKRTGSPPRGTRRNTRNSNHLQAEWVGFEPTVAVTPHGIPVPLFARSPMHLLVEACLG